MLVAVCGSILSTLLLSLNLQLGIKYKQITQNWSRRREEKINDETERKREVEVRGRTILVSMLYDCCWTMQKLHNCFLRTIRSAWWSWKPTTIVQALSPSFRLQGQELRRSEMSLFPIFTDRTSAIWSCGMIWRMSSTWFGKIPGRSQRFLPIPQTWYKYGLLFSSVLTLFLPLPFPPVLVTLKICLPQKQLASILALPIRMWNSPFQIICH